MSGRAGSSCAALKTSVTRTRPCHVASDLHSIDLSGSKLSNAFNLSHLAPCVFFPWDGIALK